MPIHIINIDTNNINKVDPFTFNVDDLNGVMDLTDYFKDFCLNQIYYYEIIIHKYEIYPYFIYLSADNSKKIAQFSEGYFKKLFIDIKQERKLKLQKINESDLHK